MKKNVLFIFALFLTLTSYSQEDFNIEIEPITIQNSPGLHSFSYGITSDGKWVFVGGRIDGLHQRQPFAAFLETSNNKDIFVLDPATNQTWSVSLSSLPQGIYEQLQSTNQQFYQRGEYLYVIGGYGYSTTTADHETFANLTAIHIDDVANAVINGTPIDTYFRQITDVNFAVTGGQVGYLDSIFYLTGGQYFQGSYNPMGPDHGPGFVQQYSEEIRMFKLIDDGVSLSFTNYVALNDPINLHRRDYNMSSQVFPTGERGFTMFSGVFDPSDLPYLNSVDIVNNNYTVNNSFTQYLSQYHSAKIPIFDQTDNAMHTVFFGGMSQYTLDAGNNLVQDDNVPFVKTISKVTRLSDGSMTEIKLLIEMPSLLGAGAEFIPISNPTFYIDEEILMINAIPQTKTLIGYIYGGIESSLPNIFFINDGTQSFASNQIFEVYINKSTVGSHELTLDGDLIFNMNVYPNPTLDFVNVEFFVPDNTPTQVLLYNVKGEIIKTIDVASKIGKTQVEVDLREFPSGEYFVSINGENYSSQKMIIKK